MDSKSNDLQRRFSQNSSFHFDGEEFYLSNAEVAQRLEFAIESVLSANYSTACVLVGQALHILQDFYSHSNWLEMLELKCPSCGPRHMQIYLQIGSRNAEFRVAPANMSTCVECDPATNQCNENETLFNPSVLQLEYLTIGYFERSRWGPNRTNKS